MPKNATLVLLRHGQSSANAAGIFTGVLDAPLSDLGRAEAISAAALIAGAGIAPSRVISSALSRARETATLVADRLPLSPCASIDVDWRLNERNYGGLTGRTKSDVRAEFGDEQFLRWRRSVDTPPPVMSDEMFVNLAASPPFQTLPVAALNRGESLRDVMDRVTPFLDDVVAPAMSRSECVLLVAHGNSLRAIVALLDGLRPDQISALNIPTGQPFLYDADPHDRRLIPGSGRYLDPRAADEAARRLAREGGT